MRSNQLFKIFIVALFMAVVVNEINVSYITYSNPSNQIINNGSLVHSSTVWSVDNVSYVSQIKNLLGGKGWTFDSSDPEYLVRRTPIYPLFYGVLYYFLGESGAHFTIRYFQVLLFALSAALISLSIFNIFKNKGWALLGGYVYAINPFIYSFCYFTITEALSPFFVVLTLYCFSRYVDTGKIKEIALCGAIAALSFLTRPTTGVIFFGIGLTLLINFLKSKGNIKLGTKHLLVLGGSFLLLLSPWVIRNYIQVQEIIIAEKFYHGAPMSFGKAHVELRYLTSTWTNPANISTEVFSTALMNNIKAKKPLENQKLITSYINQWPESAFKGYNRKNLETALHALNNCFVNKQFYTDLHPNALRKDYLNLDCEKEAYVAIHKLKNTFIQNAPLHYYFLTPLKMVKGIVFNSFVHQLAIINPAGQRYSPIQYLIKAALYLLNVLFYLSLIYFLLRARVRWSYKILLLAPILVLLSALTVLLFRYVEIRYTIPIYPLLIVTFSFMLQDVFSVIQGLLNRKGLNSNR